MLKIYLLVFFSVIFGILIVIKIASNIVNEYYSPFYLSRSIKQSIESKRFISEINLDKKSIRWRETEYPILEAWIEKATNLKYDWIFFSRETVAGYRLSLKIGNSNDTLSKDFSNYTDDNGLIVCNDEFWLTNGAGGEICYGEFKSIPSNITKCELKDRRFRNM